MEPGRRINYSTAEPREKSIDNFTAFLRKHLRGGFTKDLCSMGFERIIMIDVEKGGRGYKLYIELLPRGVIVLTDSENRILFATSFKRMRDRVIKPRIPYQQPPPPFNPMEAPVSELVKRLHIGKDLVRGIVRGWGLPGEVAEEIIYRSGLYEVKTIPSDKIPYSDLEVLIKNLKDLVKESLETSGYLVKDLNNVPITFTPFYPHLYNELLGFNVKETRLFNEAVDAFYLEYEKIEESEVRKKAIEEEIKKLESALTKQEDIIKNYTSEAEKLERTANILSANIVALENILECLRRNKEKHGWEGIIECPSVIEYNKHKGIVFLKIDEEQVQIDIRLNARQNIIKLYRLAGELKAKAKKAREKYEELQKRVKELKSSSKEIEQEALKGLRPRLWYERYHWLITSNGFLVIAGRDASQNESIVRKHLEPYDIFLHADIHGAPATVIKTRKSIPPQKDIEEAAIVAAAYSRAWREGFGSIDVYWVKGDQVSKKPPPGEYLGKGAFMIYGKKNYIRNVGLRIAIGIEVVCDEIYGMYERVISGPQSLVKKRTIAYVVLVPGAIHQRAIAEKTMEIFKKYLDDKPSTITIDELLTRIPGSSRIIGHDRGDIRIDDIECI